MAVAALNQTPFDWVGNEGNIVAAIAAAREGGAVVLGLPEMALTGYGCEDMFLAPGVQSEALRRVVQLAQHTVGIVTAVGVPLALNGAVYNGVAVLANGEVRGFVCKQNLANDGVHYEPRWFKPWPAGVVSTIEVDGAVYPVGDLVFDLAGVRIGFEICEDSWVKNRAGCGLARLGVDLILNPSASHFAFGKSRARRRIVTDGSRSFGVGYLYANLLGCEAGRLIYDGDRLIASHGEIVAEGGRFSYAPWQITHGVIDIARSRAMRPQTTLSPDDATRVISLPALSVSAPRSTSPVSPRAVWENSTALKHEEFTRAVSLGLFDYLRKSRSEGFAVSLSGGVDSSTVSCLVALMVKQVVAELGLSAVQERLRYIPWMTSVSDEASLTRHLLTCVYQRSENSSEVTHSAALGVAQEIGATFFDLDISPLVRGYTDLVSQAMGVQLSWQEHDLPLQNIQSRVRSPSVWLIANIKRALLLTTSNRSEAAVGYATMDGDTSGGLSPLGGVDKAFLQEWLSWLEHEGPHGLVRYPALSRVNAQAPTAELRPAAAHQTDEGDLMPYVVLERIERYAVRDKAMPKEILARVVQDFTGRYSEAELRSWTVRFFRLWCASQWKRERYAPSFHLDDESVDPKTWCRFPILSGGFHEELRELVG